MGLAASSNSGKRGEARAPFGAECGKTSNLQLYRVSTFRRDGPGKKSRTNSHRLAEWPQSVCLTSWCIDLCGPMQRARVFSSLLYQDVMVLDVPEKDPAQPCKKTLVPQSPPNSTRRSPPAVCVRSPARHETLGSGRGAGRGAGFREAGPCRWVRRRRRRICATCSPGPVSTHRPRVCPQVRTMAAGAEGGRQVWACITTLRAGVRTEL